MGPSGLTGRLPHPCLLGGESSLREVPGLAQLAASFPNHTLPRSPGGVHAPAPAQQAQGLPSQPETFPSCSPGDPPAVPPEARGADQAAEQLYELYHSAEEAAPRAGSHPEEVRTPSPPAVSPRPPCIPLVLGGEWVSDLVGSRAGAGTLGVPGHAFSISGLCLPSCPTGVKCNTWGPPFLTLVSVAPPADANPPSHRGPRRLHRSWRTSSRSAKASSLTWRPICPRRMGEECAPSPRSSAHSHSREGA